MTLLFHIKLFSYYCQALFVRAHTFSVNGLYGFGRLFECVFVSKCASDLLFMSTWLPWFSFSYREDNVNGGGWVKGSIIQTLELILGWLDPRRLCPRLFPCIWRHLALLELLLKGHSLTQLETRTDIWDRVVDTHSRQIVAKNTQVASIKFNRKSFYF